MPPKHTASRRQFLENAAMGSLATLAGSLASPFSLNAVDAFNRPGKPNLKLGLAAYSLRDYFKDASHPRQNLPPESRQIDLFDFISFCADLGCEGAELTSSYFPEEISDAFLLKLKHHAFMRGVAISGTAVGNQFTDFPGKERNEQISHVKQWIDRAAVMGAPHIRVFAGNAPRNGSWKEAVVRCIEGLKACCDYAAKKGVFLGIENHGGIVAEADPLIEIVKGIDSPWLGINLDTGNFHTDDPYGDLVKCAPYAVNVQLKVEIAPRGQQKRPSDLPRLVNILKEANYQGFVVLEYEAAEDPWRAIPRHVEELKPLMA
jgi:sugar phosphate isomerase/epimerase